MRSIATLPVTKQVDTRGKALDLFCEKSPFDCRPEYYSARNVSWVFSVQPDKRRDSVLN